MMDARRRRMTLRDRTVDGVHDGHEDHDVHEEETLWIRRVVVFVLGAVGPFRAVNSIELQDWMLSSDPSCSSHASSS
jgi:hypothetical protein